MNMKNVDKGTYYGLSSLTFLSMIFAILKFFGVITWSWLWVFSPMLIGGSIILVFGLILVFLLYLDKKYNG